jgi:monoamine oxidase
MSRTALFDRLRRAIRLAHYCEEHRISTEEGIARRAEAEARATQSRRQFLGTVGGVAAAGAITSFASACGVRPTGESDERLTHANVDVGAGLAGLACADQLRINGVNATLYEGNTRTGGRQYSLSGFFPGQTCEMGGELIDTSQKNMINYARTFGLTLEDYNKSPGAVFYYMNGQPVLEATVVDSYRAFVPAMINDLHGVSGAPTADTHNAYDVMVDNTSLADYLASRGADPILSATIAAAYVGEYGREINYQSTLNFLMYIRANRRQMFQPFGTSDQRYHIVEGNDGVAKGLTARVSSQIQMGMSLLKVRQTAAGRVELTFQSGNSTVVKTHDVVVIAIPFSVLRTLTLDSSLGLPDWKVNAINNLGYGSNAKNMVGFNGRPWVAQGSIGMIYSNSLSNLQNCWETSWTTSTPTSAIITNFTGGALGLSQDPKKIQDRRLPRRFRHRLPGRCGSREPRQQGQLHRGDDGVAQEPVVASELHLLRPGAVHQHRRQRAQADWQPLLRRRALRLVLRPAGPHGGRAHLGHLHRRRDSRRRPSGGSLTPTTDEKAACCGGARRRGARRPPARR